MKTAKKALLLVLCGCLLVAASIIGTMAYFTDQETVTNTFTVGKVEITLDEAQVDPYGVPSTKTGEGENTVYTNVLYDAAPRVLTNEYKLIPGHKYTKDPTVTVTADSEKSYVRMKVEVTNYDQLASIFDKTNATYYNGEVFLLQNLVKGWNNEVWVSTNEIDRETTPTSAIYEFRYASVVDVATADKNASREGVQLEPLFTEFTIPGTVVTEKNIANFNGVQIKVTAQAIQADGFADENAAWVAFDAQN